MMIDRERSTDNVPEQATTSVAPRAKSPASYSGDSRRSSAPRFSSSCSIVRAPMIVEATPGRGFPLSTRPFYTHPASDGVHAAGFDLLLRGLEVTTGGGERLRDTRLYT